MLSLIESKSVTALTEAVTKKIVERLNSGLRSYLILPEQLTVTTEREMCEILPPNAPLFFEATNFTRFANTVFRKIGGISKEYCNDAKRSLIMYKTLTELSPALEMTRGKANISTGTVKRALDAVGQVQSLGITPENLTDALKSFSPTADGRLKGKLNDLALIYPLYKKLLAEKYQDAEDDLRLLAERLSERREVLRDTVIFIDGFTSFTEPQYKVIKELVTFTDVYVTLNLPEADKGAFEYKEIKDTEAKLGRIAARVGTKRMLERIDVKDEGIIQKLSSLLWQPCHSKDPQILDTLKENPDKIRIFSANTPFDECDFVAADIKRRVMSGATYKDIAIVARNADSYVGILDTSLKREGIPHFISKTEDINSLEGIKMIYTAYGIIRGGYRREDVLTYAKCGISGISRTERDILEMYVEKWNIDGARFRDGKEWGMSPRGYEKLNAKDYKDLQALEDIRERLLRPIYNLEANLKEARTVKDHALSLIEYLKETELEQRLIKRAYRLSALGEIRRAEECARLWGIICECLDTLVEVLGELNADAESFINQLSVLFSERSIGRIPAFSDEVTIGSANSIRLTDKKYVYLIGVNRSEFPSTVTDNAYFNDRDKAALAKHGLNIEPELQIKNAKELYIFSRAFAYAKEELTISFSERTASFNEAGASTAISALKELLTDIIPIRKIKDLPFSERIYSAENALLVSKTGVGAEELHLALNKTGYGENLALALRKIENSDVLLSDDSIGVIYGKELYLTQTRIDKFLRCPMSYFCKYTLKLNESDPAEINNPVIGTFIHSILENFFDAVAKSGKNASALSKEERRKLTKKCADRYAKEVFEGSFSTARVDTVIKRLCRAAEPVVDSLCEEFANCKFTPLKFELNISDETQDTPSPVRIQAGDTDVVIVGQIDRVDTYTKNDKLYVRVVDYKTGGKDFSPEDIKEGKNLQMFLYLKSIVETDKEPFMKAMGALNGEKILPAGVIYVKASVKDTSVSNYSDEEAIAKIKENQERMGMLMKDDVSIGAMNPEFLPFDPENEKNRNKLYTEQEWNMLNKDMENAVRKIATDIKTGRFPALPNLKDRSCESCRFKAICRSPK